MLTAARVSADDPDVAWAVALVEGLQEWVRELEQLYESQGDVMPRERAMQVVAGQLGIGRATLFKTMRGVRWPSVQEFALGAKAHSGVRDRLRALLAAGAGVPQQRGGSVQPAVSAE